jgi:hypothetical protein
VTGPALLALSVFVDPGANVMILKICLKASVFWVLGGSRVARWPQTYQIVIEYTKLAKKYQMVMSYIQKIPKSHSKPFQNF